MSARTRNKMTRDWKEKYADEINKFLAKQKIPKSARKDVFQFIVRWELFRLSRKI